ncbi:MAG: hypothetical protein IH606_01770 [Burkholderiales bacterium]|nr:hypothetical protein [Burkholderiales bacterium]
MSAKAASILILVNALVSALCIGAYAWWFAPQRAPGLAVLDVGELYRLKETQVSAVLVQPDSSDADRAQALKGASAFGLEVTALIQSLPEECRCLILARGAVVGSARRVPDLTPEVRRRLGL